MRRVLAYRIEASATFCLLFVFAGIELAQVRGRRQPLRRIKHVVVIIQENISFDHYFATYPSVLSQKSVE